ncbi:MAG TPA: tetratricopeptide repeat protein [Gaiellaceae bacterium]|nr:tetratricopeptide repeat protein [Gaiellaceae bacterium]
MAGRGRGHEGEGEAMGLGTRLRKLRTTAGLTQTELAAGRFSKEYVSQIERGRTRPTPDTLAWLAERLGVDPDLLVTGVSAGERSRWEAMLARADSLNERYEHPEAASEYAAVRTATRAAGARDLELRALAGEGWARLQAGELDEAMALLTEARELSEDERFSDIERADVLFRLGACRYQLSSISTAIALFDTALELADRSELPNDLLRAQILRWRSRCYRRQRDWQAAREDVERALELAEGLSDRRAAAQVYFQASLVAEREGHWVLARSYAERARTYYEELADRENVGRLLNNLGGLTYLLGSPDEAIAYLQDSLRVLLDEGIDEEAAHVITSLAEIYVDTGRPAEAEAQARKALDLLGARADFVSEIGTAQLTLGRALLEQGRLDEAQETLTVADRSFEKMSSSSHRAAAWVALGDVAARRGDDREAARLYRRAAETLQDFRF